MCKLYTKRIQAFEDYAKKKTTLYKERCEKKRAVYLEHISKYRKEDLVYIDESGINSYIHRSHGWSKRGILIYGEVSGRRFARESFIAAKRGSEVFAPACFQGTCNTAVFNCWIENFLVPALKLGQVVIMDNASFHKSEKTRKLIEDAGCELLFLPPYSPDLNPIEIFWANFKAKIKSTINNFETLKLAVDNCFLWYTFQQR